MADSADSHRVTFIVLRFMRRPILVLVSVYAISMVGWVLIPGVNVDGKPEPLSFFQPPLPQGDRGTALRQERFPHPRAVCHYLWIRKYRQSSGTRLE
jgi:hypothetical protein